MLKMVWVVTGLFVYMFYKKLSNYINKSLIKKKSIKQFCHLGACSCGVLVPPAI